MRLPHAHYSTRGESLLRDGISDPCSLDLSDAPAVCEVTVSVLLVAIAFIPRNVIDIEGRCAS